MKTIVCTNCSSKNKELSNNVTVIKCKNCGEQVIVETALKLAETKRAGLKNVKELKKSREKYILFDIASEIKKISEELVSINPYDYFSVYLVEYAKNKLNEPNDLSKFYENSIHTLSYDLIQIINHIIKYSDIKYNEEVTDYLNNINIEDIEIYKEMYQNSYNEKINFSEMKFTSKDIYISYNEIDTQSVMVLKRMLRDSGITFLSSNTAFNDRSKLISKCHIFVSVASQHSMQSKNVIDELTLAKQQKKSMIEIKLDKVERSVLFNECFISQKSVDMRSINEKTFTILSNVIFEKLKDIQNVIVTYEKEVIIDNDLSDVFEEETKAELTLDELEIPSIDEIDEVKFD